MLGESIFANLSSNSQYNDWFTSFMTENHDYESPFGVNQTVSGKLSAQDISNSYMSLKQRQPFVIEYYKDKDDNNPTSIRMYINPEKLIIANSKIIGKQITKGGIFYHHYGPDHSTMSLSGTTGISGIAGIKLLEEIYYASGTLLRYKNYTPTQIYGSVSSFDVIDFSDALGTVEKTIFSNYSEKMVDDVKNNLYNNNSYSNNLNRCLSLLENDKSKINIDKLTNIVIPDVINKITEWKLDYNNNNLYQKIVNSIKTQMPELDNDIITILSYELATQKRYDDLPQIDKNEKLNNTTIKALPVAYNYNSMINSAIVKQLNDLKDFETREKNIRDYLRSGLINIMDELKDPWLPRQMTIYYQNRAYLGHFESFTYSIDSKTNLVSYEMKFIITKQYEFNNNNDIKNYIDPNITASDNTNIISGNSNASKSSDSTLPSEYNIYIVQSGDTLWDISKQFYGTSDYWSDIYAANKNIISDPHWIYPGQKLIIPEYSSSIRTWVVQEGDTLWDLAERFYGDATQWKKIYEANPQITNPNIIYPGQVLKIII